MVPMKRALRLVIDGKAEIVEADHEPCDEEADQRGIEGERRGPPHAVEAALSASYRRWDGQGFGGEGALPQPAAFTLGNPAPGATGSVTTLHGTVPRDQPGTLFGFYHLRLTPRPGALRPELESLSTESDADPAQFNRTYRFSWLVEHLVRSQFARGPRPASLFLTIQDGG